MNGPLPGPNYLNTTDKYSVRDYTDVNKGCGLIAERDILKMNLYSLIPHLFVVPINPIVFLLIAINAD